MQKTDGGRKNVVGGFLFLSEEDASLARQELKKIRCLEETLNYQDLNMLSKVYHKALKDKIFKTPVGLGFVANLRDRLIEEGYEEDRLAPICVCFDIIPKNTGNKVSLPVRNVQKRPKGKAGKLTFSVILNILLAVLVAGMFGIAWTSKNPNILNYKRAITDKYATWSQELSERENAVREKELELSRE